MEQGTRPAPVVVHKDGDDLAAMEKLKDVEDPNLRFEFPASFGNPPKLI